MARGKLADKMMSQISAWCRGRSCIGCPMEGKPHDWNSDDNIETGYLTFIEAGFPDTLFLYDMEPVDLDESFFGGE